MNYIQIFRGKKLLNKLYISIPSFIANILFSIYGIFKILEYKYIGKFYLPVLRSIENKSKKEIESIQEKKLRKILFHAHSNSPYYKEYINKSVIANFKVSDLPNLPLLCKDNLISYYSSIISKDYKNYKPVKQSTGGTTGTTANFLIDKKQYFWKEAEVLLHWEHHGYHPGRERSIMYRAGVFFPKGSVIPKKPWRIDYARKLLYLSSYYSSDKFYYQYYLKIKDWNPSFMHVLPSAGYLFANFLIENNLKINLKTVFTASEKLFPIQKITLSKAFNCDVVDHYGHGEPGIYAAGQCEEGNYHICDSNTIVEELDDGSIVETNLNNYSMPFIRYKVGDHINGKSNNNCRCGLTTSFLTNIDGRSSEILYTADKRIISSIGFDQIFKDNNIRLGQIIQYNYDSLDINLIPNHEYNHTNASSILYELQLRVGVETVINLHIVDDIPLAENGKFRMVISNIQQGS